MANAQTGVSSDEQEDNLSKIERREVGKMIAKKTLSHVSEIGGEFKRQVSGAIIAAFGLIIALSWKDVITDFVGRIEVVKNLGLLFSAIALTAISVLGIFLVSKWGKGDNK